MSSTRTRSAVVVAVATMLLVPTSAHASETQRINTRWDQETSGFAQTVATVRFPSRKAFDIRGWVRDACGGDPDGDGRGAYVRVLWQPRGGARHHRRIGKDTNGCGSAKRRYNPAPVTSDRRIRSVTIIVCERDEADPDGGACNLRSFHNWRLD